MCQLQSIFLADKVLGMLNSFNAQGSSLAPTQLSRQQAKETMLFATTAYSVAIRRGAQPPLPLTPLFPHPLL